MIKRANEEGITVKELADRFIAEYYTDAKALGIRPATVHPKATEHIAEIIELISRLRKDYPSILCVIISGYSDFEYMQEAIRNSAAD